MESNTHNYCVAVDGSTFSDLAFEFTISDLYKQGDKIVVIHVSNPEKLSDIPFNFKPETIISKYQTSLLGKLKQEYWDIKNLQRKDNVQHSLQQVYEYCLSYGLDVLVVGHSGHKSSKVGNNITKGINYIMNSVKLPTFIMRESLSRKIKPQFTWMICVSGVGRRSYKAFEFATKFIHTDDKVLGVHVRTSDTNSEKPLQESFETLCQSKGFKNYSFLIKEKSDRKEQVGKTISNIVNFSNEYVDILVVGKNSSKYNSVEEIPAYEIIKNSEANFLFYSEN
jgi:hypothetical protein